MLTVLDVNPTGYFSFGLHPTVHLDGMGTVLLEGLNHDRNGSANGAGKTSILNTLTSILFDKNPTGHGGEAIVNEGLGRSFGKVTFLDHNGQKWRVIITRKWKKTDKYPCDFVTQEPSEWHNSNEKYAGSDVYLERWDGTIWLDERATNTAGEHRLDPKSTRKKLQAVVGMSYQQFMNVAYLAQQQSLKFVNGTHKEKLEVLSELSDISAWDRRAAKAKERIKDYESRLDKARATLAGASGAGAIMSRPDDSQRPIIQDAIQLVDEKIAECDSKIRDTTDRSTAWASEHSSIDATIADLSKQVRTLVSSKNELESNISRLAAEYIHRCAEVRDTPRGPELYQLEEDVRNLKSAAQLRRFDLEQIMTGEGRCTRCRTIVTIEHILDQKKMLENDIRDIEESAGKLQEKLDTLNLEWEKTVTKTLNDVEIKHREDRADIVAGIQLINTNITSLNDSISGLREKKMGLGVDPKVTITNLERERMNLLMNKNSETSRLVELDRRIEQWNKYQESIDKAKADIEALETDVKYVRLVERTFGDKGIKAHKLASVLDMLNKTAQEFADVLTDNSVKVWVTPFREKVDGTTSTDMSIMVSEGEKRSVPFDLYSGGEKQQIVLAFIGAFWKVATMQGSGVNILCLDEIFGPLDELNAVGVFNYLDHMKSGGKSTIIVITHDKNIKNQLNFDSKWIVEKKNHTSQLTTDV